MFIEEEDRNRTRSGLTGQSDFPPSNLQLRLVWRLETAPSFYRWQLSVSHGSCPYGRPVRSRRCGGARAGSERDGAGLMRCRGVLHVLNHIPRCTRLEPPSLSLAAPSPSALVAARSAFRSPICAGSVISFDFRPLCNGGRDYKLDDAYGHTYYAQICGTSSKRCLPQTWTNQYEYGRTVQAWGTAPDCVEFAPQCVETGTGQPICCTEDCQVTAVRDAVFSPVVPSDLSQGIQLTYFGESPTADDVSGSDLPSHCPACLSHNAAIVHAAAPPCATNAAVRV